ncbi:hypothetical protein [Nocardia huaxiensis]|nr:hypothetical protein [Nocardia huaxiensis]
MMLRRLLTSTMALTAAITLAACGSDTKDEAGPVSSTAPVSAAPTGGATTSKAATAGAISVRSLGGRDALADASGRALYLFTKDTPNTSTCAGDCLAKWPAVPATATAGAGLDAAKFGAITRPDGAMQAAYAGKPLYYFAGDKNPGDTAGQGVNGVWYLIDATGAAIR